MAVELKWLHLSDLHVGMTDQDWLWPTLKHTFYEDMKLLHSHVGAWDLVIFSGDLTQKGSKEEFERLTEIFSELWQRFSSWGFSPKLIVLPGNHDIQRAAHLSPELLLLRRWWDESAVQQNFFSEPNNLYRQSLEPLFKNYNFWKATGVSGIDLLRGKQGILSGDESFQLKIGNTSVGIVTLNSTWLQIDDKDYEGKLHVDPKQLLAITDNDPTSWCRKNNFNILVTHHPVSWLHRNSKPIWDSEIDTPGRFDVHLFGHQHEALTSSVSAGGSPLRNSIQGPSIFGLVYTEGGKKRSHGYSINRLQVADKSRELRFWPRTLHTLQSGDHRLGPDPTFRLEVDGSIKLPLNDPSDDESERESQTGKSVSLRTIASDSRAVLSKVNYPLPHSNAHANVRKVEQRQLTEAFKDHKAAWVVAEWGMDSDGFLFSVRKIQGDQYRPCYRIDINDYKTREQFLDSVRDRLDCSFQQLCELISQSGDSLLILDNFPLDSNDSAQSLAEEVELLVAVILEYCPSLKIILRCVRPPNRRQLPVVQIRALDEADLRTYVLEHEIGGAELATPSSIGVLMRHTDGIPTRIDQALKELEVVGLPELIEANSDIISSSANSALATPLASVVTKFASDVDPARQRAFALLRVLSLFPQGEQLSRMKRFYPTAPFFPAHATELRDHALIEITTMQGLDHGDIDSLAKTLVVPRPVRECVRDQMSADEITNMNYRAADIYFGAQWSSGIFKFPAAYKFDQPNCGNVEIANACTIIIRLLREAITADNSPAITRILSLSEFFLKALVQGNHYNNVVIFCSDLTPHIPATGFEEQKSLIAIIYGRSLRMIGEHERAKEILLEVAQDMVSKSDRQALLINLAFCYKSLDEFDDAKRTAQEIIALDKYSHFTLQAKSLLIELDTNDPKRSEKLARMENTCRKEGADVVANNIALIRAREAQKDNDADKARAIFVRRREASA